MKPKHDIETPPTLKQLDERAFIVGKVDPLDPDVLARAPFPRPRRAEIRREADTEDLLNGMIAEMHYVMREVALPSACTANEIDTRNRFLGTVMELATTGAKVGKTIAKLRASDKVTELREHRIVEEIVRSLPLAIEEKA